TLFRSRSPLHLGPGAPEGVSVRVVLDGGDPAALVTDAQRVIEIVGRDEMDRERARHRWRAYRQLGIEPLRHDLALKRLVQADGTAD
ncbi:DNA polymerase III subunit chi, partial [Arthrospira platensis SPKY1]|nr:DNA polymerase III subunit chi [Arthrospira platensis SPKY1]